MKFEYQEITFSASDAIQYEIIEIRSENREPSLARVRFQRGVDHRSDELAFIDNEPDRTGAAQNRDANQEPVSLRRLILLLLVKQHFFSFNFLNRFRIISRMVIN